MVARTLRGALLPHDALRAHQRLKARPDILHHRLAREAHVRAGRVQLQQLVRTEMVQRHVQVVLEDLARRERKEGVLRR